MLLLTGCEPAAPPAAGPGPAPFDAVAAPVGELLAQANAALAASPPDPGRLKAAAQALARWFEARPGRREDALAAAVAERLAAVAEACGERAAAAGWLERAVAAAPGPRSEWRRRLAELQVAAGDPAAAIATHREGLSRARAAGDEAAAAAALLEIGTLLGGGGEPTAAAAALAESLALYRRLGDRAGEATALNNLAYIDFTVGENRRAVERYDRALALREELGEAAAAAQTRHYRAMVLTTLGQTGRALEDYRRNLAFFRAREDRFWSQATLHNLGRLELAFGEARAARDRFEESVRQAAADGNRALLGHGLMSLAHAAEQLGERQEAFDHLERALATFRALHDPYGEAYALLARARLHGHLGDWPAATRGYEEALGHLRALGERAEQATALAGLGVARERLGQAEAAGSAYRQALALARDTGHRGSEAAALCRLGELRARRGDWVGGLDDLRAALALQTAAGLARAAAGTHLALGTALAQAGQPLAARRRLATARRAFHRIADPRGEAEALYRLAAAERRAGRPAAALRASRRSIALAESLRGRLQGDLARSTFFASVRALYELQIALLMDLARQRPGARHERRAFEAGERARARETLDRLAAPAGSGGALAAAERPLRERIAAKERRRLELREAGRDAEAARLEAEVEQLLVAYRRLAGRHVAGAGAAAAPVLPAVQRELLDSQAVLLSMSLGEEGSTLWAVEPHAVTAYELPPGPVLEAAARRVAALAVARNERLAFETAAERAARIAAADAGLAQAAAELGRLLLAPAAAHLSRRRILLIPEGALLLAPFGALPDPAAPPRRDGGPPPPLVAGHEIEVVPSAAVALALRRRPAAVRPPGEVAVFADPVFDAADPRLPGPGRSGAGRPQDEPAPPSWIRLREVLRELGSGGGADALPRLPHSRQEARAIRRLAGGRSLLALDFDATVATALSRPVQQGYRILHFATHSFLDTARPELSGLVLSLYDPLGRPLDGYLRLADLSLLRPRAELVVLSGCRTALGREVLGEGMIGLARGFLGAGAPAVLATLWSAEDEPTALLMDHFYTGLLRRRLPPGAALAAAQNALAADPRWAAPYYWAGFCLFGAGG